MRKRYIVPVLLLLAAACAKEEFTQKEEPAAAPQPQAEITEEKTPYVPGVANVLFSDEMVALIESDLAAGKVVTKSMGLNQALDELGILSITRLFPDAGPYEERTRREGLHKWYTVEYDTSRPMTKASSELRSIRGVELVEPEPRISIGSTFNDPELGKQWAYNNTSTLGADVNVKLIWDRYTTGDPKVIVAVVDGGLDLKHEDLAWNCLPAESNQHHNFVDNSSTIYPHNHGTHVGGTIGAVNNNGIGVAGVAGGNFAAGQKGVRLLSCQIFKTVPDGEGKTKDQSGNTAGAIKWGADHGAVISQNSWGYVVDTDGDGTISEKERAAGMEATISASHKAAVDYFIKYAGCDNNGNQLPDSPMKGGVVFFSAGNDAMANGAPANYEPIIAVGSISQDGSKAAYSDFGDWVDISAPGSGITSTTPDNTYGSLSGTSMACPHVSGVAALIVSYFGGQGFTNAMLEERLVKGGNKSFASSTVVGPLVDALGAFTYPLDAPDAPVPALNPVPAGPLASFSATAKSNTVTVDWKAQAENRKAADGSITQTDYPTHGTMVYLSKDRSLLENMNPASPAKSVKTMAVLNTDKQIGDAMTAFFSDLDFETDYYVMAIPYSYPKVFAQGNTIMTVRTEANLPPVITATGMPEVIRLKASESLSIPVTFTEPDGHDFTVSYQTGSQADTLLKSQLQEGYVLRIVGADAGEGTYTGTITATDKYGLSATLKVTYTILPNTPPTVAKTLENILIKGQSNAIATDLSPYFNDPDGDNLSYEVTNSSPGVIHTTISGNTLNITSLAYGQATVTVTANDPRKASVSQEIRIVVREDGMDVVAYPNPVVKTLYVGTGETEAPAIIRITSATGAMVYDKTENISAFNMATIDMQGCAPGQYFLTVETDGKTYQQKIVKK